MSGRFTGGVSINNHSNSSGDMKHLRIKAGPQRDQYVHELVFKAKIMGHREAWQREHPDGKTPPPTDDRFYDYIDTGWETIDHHDNDSLNNDPGNLVRMSRGDNAAKSARRRKKAKSEGEPRNSSVSGGLGDPVEHGTF